MTWLRSLQGQMMLAIAAALLVAQGLSAWLVWHELHQRHIAALVNGAAMRLIDNRASGPGQPDPCPPGARPPYGPLAVPLPGAGAPGAGARLAPPFPPGGPGDDMLRLPRALHVHRDAGSPAQAGDHRLTEVETALRDMLVAQGETPGTLLVVARDAEHDPLLRPALAALRVRFRLSGDSILPPLVVAAERQPDGSWLTVRSFMPMNESLLLFRLLRQTILTYILLTGVVWVILRRITRPLRALTGRLASFAADPGIADQLVPQGPRDMQQLIIAQNAMEARISALLDEKNVMLGAIGHDLKTPLAALRVRIEAVEDAGERARMAATIEEINRSLDDILSLARVGRPTDPVESTDISALVADVIDEYADMGDDVVLDTDAADTNATAGVSQRLVAPVRGIWLRRALRNLVSNALRYGVRARVRVYRDGRMVVLQIDDDGPGIPAGSIARMMEPFTRAEESRNSATGGAGLGLTLARAIADQHGGSLTLVNRMERDRIAGLTALLRVPLL
ncbi:ATP-binding protein [Novosphingobium sp.]|uniref:sensor histidine kinase n=1 Tax=Novosphingobium sp. TaxID=1874826 RepID=UPI0033401FD7